MLRKWDARHLEMAHHVSAWSKDPSTKVGARITDSRNRVISEGFNGPPRGVQDDPTVDRETKLRRTIHAERNAILFARQALTGTTLYVTPRRPTDRRPSWLHALEALRDLVPPLVKLIQLRPLLVR